MTKNFTAAAGAALLLATSIIGLAAPAAADDAATAATSTPAVMPGPLKGVVLQTALDAISAATAGTRSANLPVVAQNATGPTQVIYNTTNWYVCSQSPGTGRTISAKARAITLFVRRPNEGCS